MGSGGWFKTIISLKRSKRTKLKQLEHSTKISNGSKSKHHSNWTSKKKFKLRELTPDVAATIIQSAYRAYMARKGLRRLKGIARFRGVIEERHSVKNQAISALNHIHFWSRVQAEIKARWQGMVVDSRTRQKKLENQVKLDAKLHELEVEWSGGPETMEEIVNRIQQRESAAAKRERTMAYAFSHQWRASTNQCFGQSYYDLSKESYGWSWKERWVAVRPWENRYQTRPSLVKKVETLEIKHNKTSDASNLTSLKNLKPVLSNGKVVQTNSRKTSRVSQVTTA
ncbi:Short calmodulin-binding motif protein [Castilleja foliolosa]|uniref:Short calmodulin-binding motif protein n=1 Tax=Castilleja foliolosa TaxID=1961234 RepID=A0ABD3D4Y6_9LAMI